MASREQFIESVIHLLEGKGFSGEDGHYTLQRVLTLPGKTIIINGRQMNEPAKDITVELVADIVGDGYIADKDDNIEREFTSIRFSMGGGAYEECFYWDEIEYFEQIFNKIIR
jgi:hypothetical protein